MFKTSSAKPNSKIILLTLISVFISGCANHQAQKNNASSLNDDPLAPKSSSDDAVVSPLRMATLVTNDINSAHTFYQAGFGLQCDTGTVDQQSMTLWGLPGTSAQWQMSLCKRPMTEGGITVRVLASEMAGPEVRADFDVTRNGIATLGFALKSQEPHVEQMARIDSKANAGVTTITLPKISGGTYVVKETHYKGPHNTYNLGIERPSDLEAVADIDPISGIGGPAYSAVMASDPDAFKTFMIDVMGYEARRDLEFPSSGPGGGLIGIKKGTLLRFIQMYSPGSTTDYIIVLGVGAEGKPPTSLPKPPSSGLVMWSFNTRKFNDLLTRIKTANLANLKQAVTTTHQGQARRITFEAPNGVLIEVTEAL